MPTASWDPYEVWLTRVKQPRERSLKDPARSTAQPPAPDRTGDTVRIRALTPTLSG